MRLVAKGEQKTSNSLRNQDSHLHQLQQLYPTVSVLRNIFFAEKYGFAAKDKQIYDFESFSAREGPSAGAASPQDMILSMVPLKQHLAADGSAATNASEAHDPVDSDARGGFWEGIRRTALVVVSSAALGGIAIALWNRKTLNEMRRQQDERDAE